MAKSFRKTFLGNIVILGIVCVALYWAFFAFLSWFTEQGKELNVPDLKAMQLSEAVNLLFKEGFEIDIDSIYNPEVPPFAVIDQQPEAKMTVKPGRTIFLVVNKSIPPNTTMPNLVGVSYRSALIMLKSNKLALGDTSMRPDIASGAVLEQKYKGQNITPETPIPQGSKIDLVVGDGIAMHEIEIPDVMEHAYYEAIAILDAYNLTYTVIFDGQITDTTTAKVYYQLPKAYNEFNEPNTISEGESLDIRVKQ